MPVRHVWLTHVVPRVYRLTRNLTAVFNYVYNDRSASSCALPAYAEFDGSLQLCV